MEDSLIALLATFKYPVIRQGSLTADTAYPDTFFTFFENESYEESHYNNNVFNASESYDIYVYSTDPDTAYSLQRQARDLVKANGWIITNRGFDAYSDEPTHIGRGFTIEYLKEVTQNV
jgi:hypothetical protein